MEILNIHLKIEFSNCVSKIEFSGQVGQDYGGLTRVWLEKSVKALTDPISGFTLPCLVVDESSGTEVSDGTVYLNPCPSLAGYSEADTTTLMLALGHFLALGFFLGIPLPLAFTDLFYQRIMPEYPTMYDGLEAERLV